MSIEGGGVARCVGGIRKPYRDNNLASSLSQLVLVLKYSVYSLLVHNHLQTSSPSNRCLASFWLGLANTFESLSKQV